MLGLAFENLVVNNYRELLPRLHLGGTLITSAAPYVRKKSKERDGNRLVPRPRSRVNVHGDNFLDYSLCVS